MILLSLPFADWPSLPPLARDGWELATWIIIGLVVIVLGLYRKDPVAPVLGITLEDVDAQLCDVARDESNEACLPAWALGAASSARAGLRVARRRLHHPVW